tara:strand:- start:1017 stop:1208 length:192 start_codon:yes stop_codon:yes gene_type:complete
MLGLDRCGVMRTVIVTSNRTDSDIIPRHNDVTVALMVAYSCHDMLQLPEVSAEKTRNFDTPKG